MNSTYELLGLLVGAALILYNFEYVLGRLWPDLRRFRRWFIPKLERVIPFVHPVRYAGTKQLVARTDREPDSLRRQLRSHDDVFPGTLASLQYIKRDDKRIYEIGSYAYRENGVFSTWQTHIRLFPRDDGGTLVAAHHEYNPWARPIKHFNGIDLDVEKAKSRVYSLLNT